MMIHISREVRLLFCQIAAISFAFIVCQSSLLFAEDQGGSGRFAFREGDRIVVLGNTFGERLGRFGYLETYLYAALPEKYLTLRNLSWSADEVTRVDESPTGAMDASGEPKLTGYRKLLQPRPLNFGEVDVHLEAQRPDIIFLCFGMNESFHGEEGLATFRDDLSHFIDELSLRAFSKESPPRLVLISPIAHEDLGGHFSDVAPHNRQLAAYVAAMNDVASEKNVPFVDLFHPTQALMQVPNARKLTMNGIHVNDLGADVTSRMILEQLGVQATIDPRSRKGARLRDAVREKNQQFFYRWRAVNGEYVYGRRKEPFGVVNFPQEMETLDTIVADLDKTIHEIAKSAN